MQRPVLEIPGYYYDREKGKYFKILPSSAAPPGSAYTSQDVKRRKMRAEREEFKALEMRRERGRIRRSKTHLDPLAGGLLARELGHPGLDAAHIYARGLVYQGCIRAPSQFSSYNAPLFFLSHKPSLGASMADLWTTYDGKLLTTRVNTDRNTRTMGVRTINESGWRLENFGTPGTSTSISANEASRHLAMTWLASVPNQSVVISPMIGIRETSSLPNIVLGPGVSRGRDVSIYSSTSAPPDSSLLFAFGSSHGILTLNKRDYDMNWISPKPAPEEDHPKDIFALEFLSDNTSILLSGGRRGIINITDLRIPKFGSDSDTINHPSSITHIRQVDTHRIIVAGLNSSLCQYDLRFRKPAVSTAPLPPSQWRPQRLRNLTGTRPILTYPDYSNSASIMLGFDIDLEAGIVAAAQEQDEHHEAVQLFSLHGGHKLPSRDISENAPNRPTQGDVPNVKCVRFAQDSESGMKSLYIARSPGIQRFSWARSGDSDPN